MTLTGKSQSKLVETGQNRKKILVDCILIKTVSKKLTGSLKTVKSKPVK